MARNHPISPNPNDRMGVYKQLNGVPDRYRLHHHTEAYAGRDVWEEFLMTYLFEKYESERFKQSTRRAGRRWKKHMEEHGRHHALATPSDVEAWCVNLLDRFSLGTAYNQYWVRIERFYTWLQWNTEHPHVYQPFLMAAAKSDAASTIWDQKIEMGKGGNTDE